MFEAWYQMQFSGVASITGDSSMMCDISCDETLPSALAGSENERSLGGPIIAGAPLHDGPSCPIPCEIFCTETYSNALVRSDGKRSMGDPRLAGNPPYDEAPCSVLFPPGCVTGWRNKWTNMSNTLPGGIKCPLFFWNDYRERRW